MGQYPHKVCGYYEWCGPRQRRTPCVRMQRAMAMTGLVGVMSMASVTLTQRTMTISAGNSYCVAGHRVLVKRRAGVGGEANAPRRCALLLPAVGGGRVVLHPRRRPYLCGRWLRSMAAIDGMRSALGPGSHVFIPHGTARSFRNTTRAVARMLVPVSPGACPGSFFAGPAAPEPIDVMLQDVA